MNQWLSKNLCFAFLLSGLGSIQAATLDWSSQDWNDGDLTGSFDVTTGGGDDVTISIEGDTGDLASNINDNTTLTGGFGSPDGESLFINTNYNNTGTNTVTVRIAFDYTQDVSNVHFYLFDVDYDSGQWIDLISNFQVYRGGVLQTGIFPTLTAGTTNQVNNAGTSSVEAIGVTGDAASNSSDGNLYIDFGSAIFDEISFDYTNEDPARGNQWIGLHNIDYTPAPEPGSIAAASLLLIFAGVEALRRKKKSALLLEPA